MWYSGKLFIQTQQQKFIENDSQPWKRQAESEDLGSLFFDFDNDGDLDLIVLGEWMPITLFENKQGYYVDDTQQKGWANTRGW